MTDISKNKMRWRYFIIIDEAFGIHEMKVFKKRDTSLNRVLQHQTANHKSD